MKIRYYGITDKGNFRSHNEDSFYANGDLICGLVHGELDGIRSIDTEVSPALFALADGLGGHEAGEIASRVALEKLAWMERAIQPIEELPASGWKNLFRKINQEVISYSQTIGKPRMGTTLVGCLLGRKKSWVFNIGDSRLYHLNKQGLHKITVDHSISEELGTSYGRNLLTSCIGGGTKDMEADLFDLTGKLHEGDRILLCSDGLSEVLTIDHMEQILKGHGSLKEQCLILSEEANLKLTRDNHTVVLIHIYG
ncbi:protein phosphatase [Leptospira perolatii]|uniref:Protein phosphatase n=1 Tax=Leptospira perolatii TaxID=2023191 RepID=A0A2M9ZNN1_9LEPT|nr:protein phosphatase 2C domain-containing protein [Leptospira perolatii]PJZ69657.1 protein phosphatase [Leptospira perolatii]PJZ73644.1 protein phosphatase [Leptospira perolatii]